MTEAVLEALGEKPVILSDSEGSPEEEPVILSEAKNGGLPPPGADAGRAAISAAAPLAGRGAQARPGNGNRGKAFILPVRSAQPPSGRFFGLRPQNDS